MRDPNELPSAVRAHVRALGPSRFPMTVPGAIRLHLNESPFAPSARVLDAIREASTDLRCYPDAQSEALAAALGARHAIAPQRIVLGNGSDELLSLIGSAFLEPGVEAVFPVPSFPRYQAIAALAGATPVAVPVRPDGANDADAMIAAMTGRTRVVVCATPNNPTGAIVEPAALGRLITGTPAHALLVIDEAYVEFARMAGHPDALPALAQRVGPWLSLRTFSKAHALAGLRVGFALCASPGVAECLHRVRNTFNVGRLAQAAALAALDDDDTMRRQVTRCIDARESMRADLESAGLRCLPGHANFVCVDAGRPAAETVSALAGKGILVAPVGGPPFDRHVRIGIGDAAANAAVVDALVGTR